MVVSLVQSRWFLYRIKHSSTVSLSPTLQIALINSSDITERTLNSLERNHKIIFENDSKNGEKGERMTPKI